MKAAKLVIQDEVNIKFDNLPVDIRRKLSNAMKYEVPYARHLPSVKLGRWDGKVGFFGIGGNGYLNHLDKILEILEQHNYTVTDIDDQREFVELNFESIDEHFWGDTCWPKGHPAEGEPIKLREHQVEVINNFLKNPQSLQEVATGAGKTIITATLSKIVEPIGRSLIIVPNKDLVKQTEADYINCGLDVGVYYGDRKELNRTHTICTWQSLNSLDKKSKDGRSDYTLEDFLINVSTVIVDEVHQAKADVLKNILTRNLRNAPVRWGLTGTIPKEEFEFQSILASLGAVIGQVSAKELQDKGILSKCHVNILQLIDTAEFKDYHSELKYLVTSKDRLDYLADKINSIKNTGNTLILVDRVETGKELQTRIPGSTFVNGAVKSNNRKEAYDEINEGTNQVVIATYGVAAVGINIPRIFNLVLIEPGKSFVRVIQSIGRGVRKAKDKDFVQIWDVASTCKFAKRHLTQRKKFYADAQYPYTLEKIDWK